MTLSTTKKTNWTIALGIPFLIFLSCPVITFSSKFPRHTDLLSNAILGDLLITAPFIYFLAIRKSNVSKFTVLRILAASILFAGIILRSHSSPLLQIIKTWISPILEALIIFMVSRKFYSASKMAKQDDHKVDFLFHCRKVMFQIIGNQKVANIFSSEIAVFYYSFFSRKEKSIDYKTTFTSYKENGLIVVLTAVLSILLIETIGVHFLLSLWSTLTAWVVTGLSVYTCIQLFAHIRAVKARPITIDLNSIQVHNGLAGDAFIQFNNILKIELSTKTPGDRQSIKIALIKGFENHNIVVYLKEPIEVTKIFGIKKRTDTVLFFVDRPKEFLYIVEGFLKKNVS